MIRQSEAEFLAALRRGAIAAGASPEGAIELYKRAHEYLQSDYEEARDIVNKAAGLAVAAASQRCAEILAGHLTRIAALEARIAELEATS